MFKSKSINNDIYVSSIKNDFFEYDHYENHIITFNELPHDIKESLSEFINFDKKYGRIIYLETYNLISCQIDKVTKSFEILSENDVETVLNEIIKDMDANFSKISPDTKYKFLCYKKVEINIFKYEALKNMLVVTLNYLKSYKDKVFLILKTKMIFASFGVILDITILKTKTRTELHQNIKNYLMK